MDLVDAMGCRGQTQVSLSTSRSAGSPAPRERPHASAGVVCSDLDACPGKRLLDGGEILSDLHKLLTKVLSGVTPEPDNLFFRLSRDLEGLVLLVQPQV